MVPGTQLLLLFSHSVMPDSLPPRGLQHDRPSCPSPTPGARSHSCDESVMLSNHLILCHPLLFCPQSFPASGSFPHTDFNKAPLFHQRLGSPCPSFSLSFWLIPWSAKASCVTQGIFASFLLSLSYCRLRTTRFRSIKGPQQLETV